MPTKRKHNKTRTGCKTCRFRRIKCDEERPNCGNCTRRGLDCEYFETSQSSRTAVQDSAFSSDRGAGGGVAGGQSDPQWPPRDDDREADEGISVSQTPLGPSPAWPSSSSLSPPRLELSVLGHEMQNLELLHNFTTATHATLTTDDDIKEIFRLAVPRIAFSYEPLMHALLAMSALHMSFLKPPGKSYVEVAEGHHREVLKLLRAEFPAKNVVKDQKHGTALFAAVSLVSMYVYARQSVVENVPLKAPTWIRKYRGIWAITEWRWDWVMQGELGMLLQRQPVDPSYYASKDIVFPSSLFCLSQRGVPDQLNPEELEDEDVLRIYRRATEELKGSWDRSWTKKQRLSDVFYWPVFIEEKFLGFLQEQRPRALVLLAHYCALMETVDDYFWWIKGRGVDEIARIDGILEEKWKPWLEWPKMRSSPKAVGHAA